MRAPLTSIADANNVQDKTLSLSQLGVEEVIKKLAERGIAMTEEEAGRFIDKDYKEQLKRAIDKERAHPKDWWAESGHPERQRFLKEVVLEKEADSEDERGRPVYVKERCP